MFEITLEELVNAVKGEILSGPYGGDRRMEGISIDSRHVGKGNLFVAIPGDKFDGHRFVEEAFSKGAPAIIIAKERSKAVSRDIFQKAAVIMVDDTKVALRNLACWHRRKFDIPTVAVTGTNGKTTSKEMIADVLSSKYKVVRSPKSYNNLIGVPLSLFRLNSRSQALVMELGMSEPGEIGLLTRVANPSIGVITNIGPAHLESMRSVDEIARAKFELLDNMSSPKTLVLNADDPILARRMKEKRADERVISFGIENQADFRADRIEPHGEGYIGFRVNQDLTIDLLLLGRHNVYNALAALAVGNLLGVEPQDIKGKLERYVPSELRMELVHIRDIRVINDSYNANPISMENALETLKGMDAPGRKIAVLADMLELGEKAADFHLQVGRKAAELGVDVLLTVGDLARGIGEGAKQAGMNGRKIKNFRTNQEVSHYLLENLRSGDLVLVKGSRKMRTEEVVISLKSLHGRQN